MHTNINLFISARVGVAFTCFTMGVCMLFNQALANQPNHLQLQALESQVENYIYSQLNQHSSQGKTANIQIQVRSIDKRIVIPSCTQAFAFSSNNNPNKQSNVSIKVTCPSSNWYLFMHANVAVIQQVVVSRENLSPGVRLSARNLKVIDIDKNKLRGSSFADMADIIGARIKRRIRTGNIIDERMLCFVCKGDRVTIAAVSGGLSIKVYGIAEQDGVLGDTIQVRNISSDKLVYGRIASTSQVEVSI